MKKILFFTCIMTFSASLYAQTLPEVKTKDVKKDVVNSLKKEQPQLESQIKDALMKDEGLQKKALEYLKSNPDTTKSLTQLTSKNKGSNKGIMKSILGDKDLTKLVVDYISENPELLKKAMKVIGM